MHSKNFAWSTGFAKLPLLQSIGHTVVLLIQTVGLWWSFSLFDVPFSTPVNFTHAPSNTGPAENWLKPPRAKRGRHNFTAGTVVNTGTKPGGLQHVAHLSAPALACNVTPGTSSLLVHPSWFRSISSSKEDCLLPRLAQGSSDIKGLVWYK